MTGVLAAIPAPPFDQLGPLNLYGLLIALGVIAAIWLLGRRFEERGAGTSDDASSIGVGAVIGGIIGARLYHVATDWDRFSDDLGAIPRLWEGGLGIPGGLLVGIPTGLYLARRRGISAAMAATCAAPTIPLAQAIGRWGNYFNQELYGRPTELPWALEVDPEHLVADPDTGVLFEVGTTFHPTFLYESLWNLALCGALIVFDKRFKPGGGSLMAIYVAGYGLGRFWVEGLRVDPADTVAGLRWNQWVAVAAVVGGSMLAVALAKRSGPDAWDPETMPVTAVAAGEVRESDTNTSGDDTSIADDEHGGAAADSSDDTADAPLVAADGDASTADESLVAADADASVDDDRGADERA
ncbi:MAG: prolipoprotein diacylglyceryl transferase [Actinomycetota bacterium]